uniref:Plethodontid modulating factor n=1 Tax=Romanomermis culicivorax TaxID=13658 RepID=A0A915J553_ROMCU
MGILDVIKTSLRLMLCLGTYKICCNDTYTLYEEKSYAFESNKQSLTAYKDCCNNTDTLFEEKSFAF